MHPTVADTRPLRRRGAALASTYRLQLRTPDSDPDGGGLTLDDAAGLVPYLARLGVGAVYLSPILTATPGSTHGYDVVDPTTVSAGLGGPDALRRLRAACREHGLGLVVDIVPNHLGVDSPRDNAAWWDVLRLGRDSSYAGWFDVDWSTDNGCDGRIALPVLGAPEDVDALEVDRSGDEPELRFYEHRFPVAPGTDEGSPREVHDRQHYRLVHWREPLLGYRRFFTVTGLAGLRQEDAEVFDSTHVEVARWCAEDLVDGIRVDHPDGLADPIGYTRRLRDLAGDDRWIVVEKILAPDEVPDPAMPVAGTTGYDALRLIDQLLVDPAGRGPLTALAERWSSGPGDEGQVRADSEALKRDVVTGDLVPELRRLVRTLPAAPGGDDPSADALAGAFAEIVAATPYYRADYPVLRGTIPGILDRLGAERPELAGALRVVGDALAGNPETSARLAQVTGAATAKAEEDRLFYRLGRLVGLNEVGGSPGRMGLPVEAFHLAMSERAEASPLAMTALSTHDTKRGEDVRARISVLSQVPGEWEAAVDEIVAACPPPAMDAAYFLLQNIVGVWPEDGEVDDTRRARLHAYAEKAMREAAVHTTWTDPDAAFEDAIHGWIDALVDRHPEPVTGFVRRIAAPGRETALVAKALQLLVPGIPDVYQGTEIWEDSLVDPDNRRPVDHRALASGAHGAHPKFALVREALHLRRAHPLDLASGAHRPLAVSGAGARDVVAFSRDVDGRPGVVLVARLRAAVVAPRDLEGTTVALPDGDWVDREGRPHGSPLDAGAALADSPVLILRSSGLA